MKKINLSGIKGMGKYMLVDDVDFSTLSKHKWFLQNGYARRMSKKEDGTPYNKRKNISASRAIMNFPKQLEIDHINGNPLDNRRANLRLATRQQNAFNRHYSQSKKHDLKGIYQRSRKKPWVAQIFFNNRAIYLGSYYTKEEAAITYNKKAKEFFGEFAWLNKV